MKHREEPEESPKLFAVHARSHQRKCSRSRRILDRISFTKNNTPSIYFRKCLGYPNIKHLEALHHRSCRYTNLDETCSERATTKTLIPRPFLCPSIQDARNIPPWMCSKVAR